MNVTERRGANHGLHLVLSLLTCGLWAVTGWPLAALLGRRTVTHIPFAPQPAWTRGQIISDGFRWNPYANRWEPLDGHTARPADPGPWSGHPAPGTGAPAVGTMTQPYPKPQLPTPPPYPQPGRPGR